jgi:hypothetical protein
MNGGSEGTKLETLFDTVVERHFPELGTVWELQKETILSDVVAGHRPPTQKGAVDAPVGHGFGIPEVMPALALVQAIWNTYKVVKEVRKEFGQRSSKNDLSERWNQQLIEAGVPAAKAKAVIDDCLGQLEAVVGDGERR